MSIVVLSETDQLTENCCLEKFQPPLALILTFISLEILLVWVSGCYYLVFHYHYSADHSGQWCMRLEYLKYYSEFADELENLKIVHRNIDERFVLLF